MVGFPIDYGDNLSDEQAKQNAIKHAKVVAWAMLPILINGGGAFAVDNVGQAATQKESAAAINQALGKNPNVIGFLAGMICVGLATSLSGPVGMFAVGAFCAGSFGYLVGLGR